MDHDLLIKAFKAAEKGKSYAFATIIESTKKGTPQKTGAKILVLEDGTLYGTIGGGRNEEAAKKECLAAIKKQKTKYVTYDFFGQEGQSVCGGQIKVFIEPQSIKEDFIICGAGHIALPLSAIIKLLNFKLTIIDNRKSFANKTRFPHADKILCGNHRTTLKKIPITNQTYIMIVTQGNEFDFECLKNVLKSKAAYIGVISSKAKQIKFFKRLKEEGFTQKYLKKILIPAGIDIGAQTPEEIAVSISAEVIKIRNQNKLNSAKFQNKE